MLLSILFEGKGATEVKNGKVQKTVNQGGKLHPNTANRQGLLKERGSVSPDYYYECCSNSAASRRGVRKGGAMPPICVTGAQCRIAQG